MHQLVPELRKLIETLPTGAKREAATKDLEQAERELRLPEAEAAAGFGYPLCQCTFPPQVMLLMPETGQYKCPHCGTETKTPRRPLLGVVAKRRR